MVDLGADYTAMSRPHTRGHLIWDFDGTLAYRSGQWSGAVAEALRRFGSLDADIETIRPFMRRGFPWHAPERANPPGRSASDWWRAVHPAFEEAFAACGATAGQARELAGRVREVYTDLSWWRVFDDTVEVLAELRARGWRHAVLSNHVPELPQLIRGLGLDSLIETVVNSAETGYEKPHPRAFAAALAALPRGGAGETEQTEEIWMIGDNIEADILGAEAVGLRAILVRNEDPRASRAARGLRDVIRMLG